MVDRIPGAVRAEILSTHAAGRSAHALATTNDISRNSVLALVSAAGVPRNIRRMTEHEIDEAVRLYQIGMFYASVGKQLDFGATAIADALKRWGVRTSGV